MLASHVIFPAYDVFTTRALNPTSQPIDRAGNLSESQPCECAESPTGESCLYAGVRERCNVDEVRNPSSFPSSSFFSSSPSVVLESWNTSLGECFLEGEASSERGERATGVGECRSNLILRLVFVLSDWLVTCRCYFIRDWAINYYIFLWIL